MKENLKQIFNHEKMRRIFFWVLTIFVVLIILFISNLELSDSISNKLSLFIFDSNYSTRLLISFVLFLIALIFMKNKKIESESKKCVIISFLVFIFAMLFAGSNYSDEFENIRNIIMRDSGNGITLFQKLTSSAHYNPSHDLNDETFLIYFTDKKTVYVNESNNYLLRDNNYITTEQIKYNNIIDSNQYDCLLEKNTMAYCLSNGIEVMFNDNYDKDTNLILLNYQNKGIICSYDSFISITDSSSFSKSKINYVSLDLLDFSNTRTTTVQFILLIVFYLVGILFLNIVINKHSYLIVASAMPIGASIFTIIFSILLLLGINVSKSIFFVIVVLVIVTLYCINVLFHKKMNSKLYLLSFIIFCLIASIAIFGKFLIVSHDSFVDALYSYKISKNVSIFAVEFDSITSYGLFSIIVNYFSYLLGGDIFYSIYPCISISIVFSIVSIYFGTSKKAFNTKSYLIIIAFILLLLIQPDYLSHSFYMHNNEITAFNILILIASFIYMAKDNDNYYVLSLLSITMIMQSRIEGSLYILLILAIAYGFDTLRKKSLTLMMITSIEVIVWNLVLLLFIGFNEDTYFWSFNKGLLLIFSYVFIFGILYFANRNGFLKKIINKSYFLIFNVLVFLFFIFCVFYKSTETIENAIPFIKMLLINNLWLCLFVIAFILIINKNSIKIMSLFFGYVILVFCIFLFRGNNEAFIPINSSCGDSARRCLYQMLPSLVLILSCEIRKYLDIKGGDNSDK